MQTYLRIETDGELVRQARQQLRRGESVLTLLKQTVSGKRISFDAAERHVSGLLSGQNVVDAILNVNHEHSVFELAIELRHTPRIGRKRFFVTIVRGDYDPYKVALLEIELELYEASKQNQPQPARILAPAPA